MACDICGAVDVHLEKIRDIYKTDDICDICDKCMKIVNHQLDKIRTSHVKAQWSLLQRFMTFMKGGNNG